MNHIRSSATETLPPLVLASSVIDRLRGAAHAAMRNEPEIAEQLLTEIERADVVSPEAMPATVVGIGNWVTYQDMTSGSIRTIQLVLPHEAHLASQRISVVSPIGAALIGLSVGQVMNWRLSDQPARQLTVIKVASDLTDPHPGAKDK